MDADCGTAAAFAQWGKSIKEFVPASTLGQSTEDDDRALLELEALLDRRVERAKADGFSSRTVEDIFQQAIDDAPRD